MQKLYTLALVVTLAALPGCGKSEAEKQAEAAAKAAEAATQAATAASQQAGSDVAKGMAEMAKAISGGAPTGPDGKPVEPVSLDALSSSLPQMSGWDMAQPEGQLAYAPFAISQTETRYTKGDNEIEVKVVDTATAQVMLIPWSMMMAAGYQKQSSDGYEKAITVGGNPGFERWRKNGGRGELNILIKQRFMVTIKGDDLTDTKVLHEFASKMNAGALK